ncbi:hypothetical protein EP7_002010 [Isosphaeraceae bacterium EP7]
MNPQLRHPSLLEKSRHLVASRHVTFCRGVRVASSDGLTGRGESAASRRRFCGRPPVEGFGTPHGGTSAETTLSPLTPTTECRPRPARPSQNRPELPQPLSATTTFTGWHSSRAWSSSSGAICPLI